MNMLDDIVFNSALTQAYSFLNQGYDPETAADYACHGVWAVYRLRVLEVLLAERKVGRAGEGPLSR